MSALNGKPCPASGDGAQAMSAIIVSCVKSAVDTTTQDYGTCVASEALQQLYFNLGGNSMNAPIGKGRTPFTRPPMPVSASDHPVNDTERAQRFAKAFAGELRYVQAWKKWLAWNGVRWAPDENGAVIRKAQEMSKRWLEEAAQIVDFEHRKKAAGVAIRAGDKSKIEAMITLAQSQVEIAAAPTLFDSDPLLLGVSNGVVDLRTGKFREARKEDYIIKQAGTAYDAAATCPTWEKFLSRVLSENAQLISFIQRAVGYSLTGEIVEQVLFFLYGTGQNGKSTFAETLKHLFGTYMIKATTALYTLDRYGSEPLAEIARLVGKRLVTGSETEEGARLAESRVKDITGGDTLTGRELYCSAFNFQPTHKLWIYGNHRPDVRGNDEGIWRRIMLIPFKVQIPEKERDPKLLEKLLQELPGILNWAIKGCLEWQKSGLAAPRIVLDATADYREEEDELGDFIAERCVPGQAERSELFSEYKNWAEARGIKMPMKDKAFAKRIRVRPGISESKSNGKRYWDGIAVRPANLCYFATVLPFNIVSLIQRFKATDSGALGARYLFADSGAGEAASFWKAGSERNGSVIFQSASSVLSHPYRPRTRLAASRVRSCSRSH